MATDPLDRLNEFYNTTCVYDYSLFNRKLNHNCTNYNKFIYRELINVNDKGYKIKRMGDIVYGIRLNITFKTKEAMLRYSEDCKNAFKMEYYINDKLYVKIIDDTTLQLYTTHSVIAFPLVSVQWSDLYVSLNISNEDIISTEILCNYLYLHTNHRRQIANRDHIIKGDHDTIITVSGTYLTSNDIRYEYYEKILNNPIETIDGMFEFLKQD